ATDVDRSAVGLVRTLVDPVRSGVGRQRSADFFAADRAHGPDGRPARPPVGDATPLLDRACGSGPAARQRTDSDIERARCDDGALVSRWGCQHRPRPVSLDLHAHDRRAIRTHRRWPEPARARRRLRSYGALMPALVTARLRMVSITLDMVEAVMHRDRAR